MRHGREHHANTLARLTVQVLKHTHTHKHTLSHKTIFDPSGLNGSYSENMGEKTAHFYSETQTEQNDVYMLKSMRCL